MWGTEQGRILAQLGLDWFRQVAEAMPAKERVADLLETRVAPALQYITQVVSPQSAAELISLMDPQQANWLIDKVQDEDLAPIFSHLSMTDRVMLYAISPARYIGIAETLGDSGDTVWWQDAERLKLFADLLAEADPGRVDAALRGADWEQAAELLALMPPRKAARICIQTEDFSSVNNLGFAMYEMDGKVAARILENCPRRYVKECLLYMGDIASFRILRALRPDFATKLIQHMEADDVAAILREGPPVEAAQALATLEIDDQKAADVRAALNRVDESED
jgi:Mg/Co/Ni transporter MgtE